MTLERTRNTLTVKTTWKRVKVEQESTPHPDVAQPEPAESPTRRIPTFFVVVGVACWILAVNVLFNHGSKENNTAGLLSLAGFLALIGWGVYSLRRRRPSGAAAAVTVPHGDVPPNASEPLPEIADALAPGNADRSTQARLAELERLAGAGVITTAERNSRRTAIIEEI